ncbi:MAG TPA: hypothetical protein VE907_13105 [Gammaproteobacteria bacterium]|nr:hypothetical protein [Gammaproteobacteria bacterium]
MGNSLLPYIALAVAVVGVFHTSWRGWTGKTIPEKWREWGLWPTKTRDATADSILALAMNQRRRRKIRLFDALLMLASLALLGTLWLRPPTTETPPTITAANVATYEDLAKEVADLKWQLRDSPAGGDDALRQRSAVALPVPDSPEQADARKALYEYFDRPFVAAVSPLREFATLIRVPLGNLPLPSEARGPNEALIGALFEYSVVRTDFDATWERFSTAIDTSKREKSPVPFPERSCPTAWCTSRESWFGWTRAQLTTADNRVV